jgi:hypothetical protein
MKKFILYFLFIFSISLFGFIQNQGSEINNNLIYTTNYQFVKEPVPDVMGNICVISSDGKIYTQNIFDTDSFPVFSGFPKNISGSTFEGGIICNMDADADMEIVYNIGYTVQAWNFDGTSVPGWPQTVASYVLEGAPAFGDIDGDGEGEIVVTNHGLTSGGFIYAFHKNGTPVTGFPVNHGYSSRTPVLANMDNSGGLEIIVNKRLSSAGEVYVYRGDGSVFPGWPKSINHVPASSSAVGDITGDNIPEVISESYSSLYAWSADGSPLPGFPFTMPNSDVNSYSSPVLADLDGDNIRDIVFGTHVLGGGGYIYAVKNNGTVISGWPNYTGYWIYSPPSVGFINGDNNVDVAIGNGGGTISGSPVFSLLAFNKNGTALTGFPVNGLWSIDNQVLIGDVDNDNFSELIIDDNTTSGGMGKYLGFNHDGTQMTGNWPIYTTLSTFFSTPMLWDVNRDGALDIAGSGGQAVSPAQTNVYLWNTGVPYNPAKIYVPMWQYNTRHNGVYGDVNVVAVTPVSNKIPESYMLKQNYPNPFNPATVISFQLPANNYTSLKIYDAAGRQIDELVNSDLKAGEYEIKWNASNYTSGVYFYKLITGNFTSTKKMILVK